jgi:hypothetical protein
MVLWHFTDAGIISGPHRAIRPPSSSAREALTGTSVSKIKVTATGQLTRASLDRSHQCNGYFQCPLLLKQTRDNMRSPRITIRNSRPVDWPRSIKLIKRSCSVPRIRFRDGFNTLDEERGPRFWAFACIWNPELLLLHSSIRSQAFENQDERNTNSASAISGDSGVTEGPLGGDSTGHTSIT